MKVLGVLNICAAMGLVGVMIHLGDSLLDFVLGPAASLLTISACEFLSREDQWSEREP